METRDQWYKPNLLYNIHYRPPKKSEPPKMIVETVQFNPSVCTCGEHGCQPQYRMEKRVLWTTKEAFIDKQRSNIKEEETKHEHRRNKEDEHRENNFQESIIQQDRKIDRFTESKQIGEIGQEHRHIECYEGNKMDLKEEIGQKCYIKVDDSKQMGLKEYTDPKGCFKYVGNKFGAAESFEEKVSGDVEVRSGYKANYAVKENGNVDVQGDDEEKEEKKDWYFENEIACNESKKDGCIDEQVGNTNTIKESTSNSNSRSERDNSKVRNREEVCGEKHIGNASESDCSNDCKGDENSSKADQIDKDYTAGGDGMDDSDSAGDDAEYCSENIMLTNDCNEIAESCSLETEDDGGWEDVEIASAFVIMTIYCNSKLHNWNFICEGALRKIHAH